MVIHDFFPTEIQYWYLMASKKPVSCSIFVFHEMDKQPVQIMTKWISWLSLSLLMQWSSLM